MVGIAFSVGFVVGPMIGALFARISTGHREGQWYAAPALFALFLSVSDLLFVVLSLEETLPANYRAKSLAKGISGALTYINPIDLFQFNGVVGLNTHGMLYYVMRI